MADVAASPNDPLFINHHSMVDCIFEEWLKAHPDAEYPPNVPEELKGHQKNGYIVPFFPLFTHNQLFKKAEEFGYSCELSAAVLFKPFTSIILVVGGLVSLMNV